MRRGFLIILFVVAFGIIFSGFDDDSPSIQSIQNNASTLLLVNEC